jgi:hypothetical protein
MQQEDELLKEIQEIAMDENIFGEGFNKEDLQRQLQVLSGRPDINIQS